MGSVNMKTIYLSDVDKYYNEFQVGFIKEYSEDNTNVPIYPAICYTDTSVHTYWCHNPFNSSFNRYPPKEIGNALTAFTGQEGAIDLVEFLFDPEISPYKDALKDMTLVRDNETKNILFHSWSEGVFTPFPALIGNLLIATRLHTAWGLGPVFIYLLEHGFSKAEALGLSPLFSWDEMNLTHGGTRKNKHLTKEERGAKGALLTSLGYQNSDQPFSYQVSTKRLEKGDYNKPESESKITPSNYLWNNITEVNLKDPSLVYDLKREAALCKHFNSGETTPDKILEAIKKKRIR